MKEDFVFSDDGRIRLSYLLEDDGTFYVSVFAPVFGDRISCSTSKSNGESIWVSVRGKVES